jgi:hypothetical protein
MTLKIFVSHSHKDADWCTAFVDELNKYEVDIWYDNKSLQGGDEWVKEIEQQVESRDIFVLILSPDAWESRWVKEELGLALIKGKQIITIIHKQTQVHGFIEARQMIDMNGKEGDYAARELVNSLHISKHEPNVMSVKTTKAPLIKLTRQQLQEIDISGTWISETINTCIWRMEVEQSSKFQLKGTMTVFINDDTELFTYEFGHHSDFRIQTDDTFWVIAFSYSEKYPIPVSVLAMKLSFYHQLGILVAQAAYDEKILARAMMSSGIFKVVIIDKPYRTATLEKFPGMDNKVPSPPDYKITFRKS